MAIIISVSAVILGCILLVHAEPPVNSYSISGDNNAYDYSNSITNGGYLGSKDGHKESGDFFTGTSNGHSLISSGNQGNIGGSLGTNSFNGFSPSFHNNGFGGYSSTTRENLAGSSYSLNGHGASSFGGYTNSNSNGDSTFEGYATGANPAGSDFNQYSSSNHKSPSYIGFSDSVSGATNAGSYSEVAAEGSHFKGFSGGSFRSPMVGGYLDADHAATGESAYLFNGPSNEYPYGKHKDSIFGIGSSNKYVSDVYSSPSDMRYIRGSHGSVHMGRDHGSPMYLSNSGPSSPFSSIRGNGPSPSLYTSGKIGKYGKYVGDYSLNAGFNFPSKDQESDYLASTYSKGGGKVVMIKDGRPNSYGSQAYSNGPSYLSKVVGNYKSKPSNFMSYPGPNAGYSSMSNMQHSFSGSNYGDGHLPRGYRSSSKYAPGYASTYPSYY